MTIEPNKFYRTRAGRKAHVAYVDLKEEFPVAGRIEFEGHQWTSLGRWGAVDSPHDLIAEWTDAPIVNWQAMPAWAQWVAMDEDRRWFWFCDKPFIYVDGFSTRISRAGIIPMKHCPTYSGDWKSSLVERPKQ